MSLRSLIWIGAVMAAGCGGQVQEPGVAGAIQDPTLDSRVGTGCPDPGGCTSTNGTGVYYEEGGSAGIDTFNLMITHFTNNGASVTFQGRYLSSPNWWLQMAMPGTIDYAEYNGATYGVVSISEAGTYPTFTLLNWSTNTTFTVVGYYLNSLMLHISITSPFKKSYWLEFSTGSAAAYNYEARKSTVEAPQYQYWLYEWDMKWRFADSDGAFAPYCQRAKGPGGIADDQIVFQGGIDVVPTTGTVTANSKDVTFSCRYGAIATVYQWGYAYTDLYRYGAAIHMKRASYCGDATYHTISGTKFQFEDDLGVATDPVLDANVEAFWTPTGAACVNVKNPRRPDLAQYPDATGTGTLAFDGTCNGKPVPSCDTFTGYPYYDSISQSMAWAKFMPFPDLVDGIVAQ